MTGTPSPPALYAFVSYASADRERVELLVEALQRAGVAVWLDREGIRGGANYGREIAQAIKDSAALVLMASPLSMASRNVRQEIALAWEYERPYVPLLLEPVAIPDGVRYWLTAAQWVEVLDKPMSNWLPQVLAALAPLGIAPPPPAPAPPERLPGREREQGLLGERLEAAMGGRGGLVLVGGEAGVGKTTLVEATLTEAAARGALMLIGRCYDLAETPPYGPWVELFGRYRPGPGDPPHPPAFATRGTVGAVASQAALVAEVRDWLAALAASRPVALLLDDLHWADPASLDLLRAVARDLADLPVLVLATYRDDELTRRHPLYALLPVLEREARATRLDLRRFDVEGVRALVAQRFALPEGDGARLVAWLHGRSEGNAFFTTQLLRALEEEGALRQVDDGWALGDLGAVGMPTPLRQVLDARLARLGDGALQLLSLAAVIGLEVPLALWATVSGTDEDGLLDTIERAVEARLLEALPAGDAVRFAHGLIREALYEGTLPMRRRPVHRQVAEALAATPSPDPDAVAHHLQRAGDRRAAAWLVRAGERATHAYAWLTAATRYEAALALLGEGALPPGERARLLLTLANLRRYSAPAQGVALAEEAARLAAAAGDPILAAAARFDGGNLRGLAGATRTGAAEMEAAWPALAGLTPTERARLPIVVVQGFAPEWDHHRAVLALYFAVIGRYREALALSEPFARRAPGTSPRGLQGLGYAYAMLGQPADCWRAYADSRAGFAAVGQHREVFHTLAQELEWSLRYRGDRPGALARLADEAARALERASGVDPGDSYRLSDLPLLWLAGRWAEGRALVLAAREADRSTRMLFARPWLGRILHAQGDAARAWEIVREGLPGGAAGELDTELPQALALQQLAVALALDAGDRDTAHAWLAAHDGALARSGAVLGRAEGALGWAAYHRTGGDVARARHHAEQALAHASDPRQPLALLAAHRLLGELGTADAPPADARVHFDAALVLADACAAPYERALTLLALAELRVAEGNREQSRALLAEARAILASLEARPALARAAKLAASLGGADAGS